MAGLNLPPQFARFNVTTNELTTAGIILKHPTQEILLQPYKQQRLIDSSVAGYPFIEHYENLSIVDEMATYVYMNFDPNVPKMRKDSVLKKHIIASLEEVSGKLELVNINLKFIDLEETEEFLTIKGIRSFVIRKDEMTGEFLVEKLSTITPMFSGKESGKTQTRIERMKLSEDLIGELSKLEVTNLRELAEGQKFYERLDVLTTLISYLEPESSENYEFHMQTEGIMGTLVLTREGSDENLMIEDGTDFGPVK